MVNLSLRLILIGSTCGAVVVVAAALVILRDGISEVEIHTGKEDVSHCLGGCGRILMSDLWWVWMGRRTWGRGLGCG